MFNDRYEMSASKTKCHTACLPNVTAWDAQAIWKDKSSHGRGEGKGESWCCCCNWGLAFVKKKKEETRFCQSRETVKRKLEIKFVVKTSSTFFFFLVFGRFLIFIKKKRWRHVGLFTVFIYNHPINDVHLSTYLYLHPTHVSNLSQSIHDEWPLPVTSTFPATIFDICSHSNPPLSLKKLSNASPNTMLSNFSFISTILLKKFLDFQPSPNSILHIATHKSTSH